jgi:hypothetical protein
MIKVKITSQPEHILQEYMSVLDFSPQCLQANRRGEISQQQRKRLRNNRIAAYVIGLLATGLMAFLLFYLPSDVDSWRYVLIVPPVVIALTIYVFVAKIPQQIRADLHSGQAVPIREKEIQFIRKVIYTSRPDPFRLSSQKLTEYMYSIGERRYTFNEKVHNVFQHYPPQCVYISRWSKQILSVE